MMPGIKSRRSAILCARPTSIRACDRTWRVLEWKRLEKVALEGFRNFLERYRNVIDRDDLEETAGILCYFFNFMTLGKLLHSDEVSSLLLRDRDAFARELATFAHHYLIRSKEK